MLLFFFAIDASKIVRVSRIDSNPGSCSVQASHRHDLMQMKMLFMCRHWNSEQIYIEECGTWRGEEKSKEKCDKIVALDNST